MHYIKKILIIVFLNIGQFVFANSSVLKNSVFNICTTADYKPVLYKLPSGEYVGVAPDILNGFSKKEGLLIRYIVFSYNGLIPALLSNKCDLIATGMAATDERKKVINFTLGMYKSQSYIVYAKNNLKLKNSSMLNDFNKINLIAGIGSGSIYETFIQKNNPVPNASIKIFDSESDISTALIANRIDFTFNGSQFLTSLTKANPNKFDYIKLNITNADIAFGIRKSDNFLLSKINSYIEELNKNGEHARILKKNDVHFISGY
ncbi:MAG: ABC transporter substrate-binding protein [Bdellovibrionota bacterium]